MNDLFNHINTSKNKTQVILFPFLGGSSRSFTRLENYLKERIDVNIWAVNPPGHGGSPHKLVSNMADLVELYAGEIKDIMSEETIFFGHSMGGMVAYHLTKYLKNRVGDCLLPKSLILSACGPGITLDRTIYSEYSEPDLINRLCAFGAMPDELKTVNAIQKFFIPVFRSDYKIMESIMDDIADEKLDLSANLICGSKDKEVSISASMEWRHYFNRPLSIYIVKDGEHMFINQYAKEVADEVVKIVHTQCK